jgi:hypothetical protein
MVADTSHTDELARFREAVDAVRQSDAADRRIWLKARLGALDAEDIRAAEDEVRGAVEILAEERPDGTRGVGAGGWLFSIDAGDKFHWAAAGSQ